MSEMITKLLARFEHRLANDIGLKESNEMCVKWIREYIKKTQDMV